MDTLGRQVLVLILCLLLRNIRSQDLVDDTVDGVVNRSAILPCSFTIPSNLRDDELQVIWFKNFTEKLWDCAVKRGKMADCRSSPKSYRTQILWKVFGNVDLQMTVLRESDSGLYQCWIILSDTYRRRDVALRVHGRPQNSSFSEGAHKDPFPVVDSSGQCWGLAVTVYSWSIFLLGTWPVVLFLAGFFWAQRRINKRKSRLISVI